MSFAHIVYAHFSVVYEYQRHVWEREKDLNSFRNVPINIEDTEGVSYGRWHSDRVYKMSRVVEIVGWELSL